MFWIGVLCGAAGLLVVFAVLGYFISKQEARRTSKMQRKVDKLQREVESWISRN